MKLEQDLKHLIKQAVKEALDEREQVQQWRDKRLDGTNAWVVYDPKTGMTTRTLIGETND